MSRLFRVPSLGLVIALAIAAGLFGGIAIADNHDDVFYGCEKGGKLIPGSLTVNEVPDCEGNSLRSWNSVGPPGADGADGASGEGLSCANQEAIKDQIPAFELSEPCKLDIFAIAYINVDTVDGFTEGTDILIAKLIDGPNNDGVMGAGDLVVTDKYPLDPDATATGQFQATSHTVVSCGFISAFLKCGNSSGDEFKFRVSGAEEYQELRAGNLFIFIGDNRPCPAGSCDTLTVDASAPSAPDTPVSVPLFDRPEDDLFIDVDIFVTP